MVTASEAREPNAYRDCNRLLRSRSELRPRPFNRPSGSFVRICCANAERGVELRIVYFKRRLPLVEHLSYLADNGDEETDGPEGDRWHAAKGDVLTQDSGEPVD